MALSTTIVDIRGKAYEPVISEILFKNKTIANNLVNFCTDIKANTIFTENSNSVKMQAFTAGAPTASGTTTVSDVIISPVKVMYYEEINPDSLRTSRFNRTMSPGAWEIASTEFDRIMLENISYAISSDAENKFWNGALSATQTSVAALATGSTNASVSTEEKAYVASLTPACFDGVVTRLIYNNGGVGGRIKVVGTTISSSNIATEYAKLYAAIPAEVLEQAEAPYIYAPRSHKQFINIYNSNATYRDLFSKEGERYFYNGVEIVFVPVPENTMICAQPSNIHWCTDLLDDTTYLKWDKIANNREDMFYKNVQLLFAHVTNQKFITLYKG